MMSQPWQNTIDRKLGLRRVYNHLLKRTAGDPASTATQKTEAVKSARKVEHAIIIKAKNPEEYSRFLQLEIKKIQQQNQLQQVSIVKPVQIGTGLQVGSHSHVSTSAGIINPAIAATTSIRQATASPSVHVHPPNNPQIAIFFLQLKKRYSGLIKAAIARLRSALARTIDSKKKQQYTNLLKTIVNLNNFLAPASTTESLERLKKLELKLKKVATFFQKSKPAVQPRPPVPGAVPRPPVVKTPLVFATPIASGQNVNPAFSANANSNTIPASNLVHGGPLTGTLFGAHLQANMRMEFNRRAYATTGPALSAASRILPPPPKQEKIAPSPFPPSPLSPGAALLKFLRTELRSTADLFAAIPHLKKLSMEYGVAAQLAEVPVKKQKVVGSIGTAAGTSSPQCSVTTMSVGSTMGYRG